MGSSHIRGWTCDSHIERQILYHWAIREAPWLSFKCVLLKECGLESTGLVVVVPGLSCSATFGFWPAQGLNHVSCICRWSLYHWASRRSPVLLLLNVPFWYHTDPVSWFFFHICEYIKLAFKNVFCVDSISELCCCVCVASVCPVGGSVWMSSGGTLLSACV